MKRKLIFLKIILIFILWVCNSPIYSKFLSIDNLTGEELKYRFSFFIFRKAAIVKLNFKHIKENFYEATLKGQTKGIIGMFTAFRKDIYISNMYYDNQSKRLIPIKFTKITQIGEKIRKSIYEFDYNKNEIIKTKEKIINSKLKSKKRYIIKFKPPVDDYLTLAYNFRMGVYGFPKKNNPLKIEVLPEKKKKKFIEIFFIKEKKNKIKLKAKIVKDIVKTKKNEIYGIIDKNMIPLKGILPGVPIFGDIKAYLISLKYSEQPAK